MAIETIPHVDVQLSFHHTRPKSLDPVPLKRISFSAWKSMSDCMTKYAFARDLQTRKWNTGSTAASLGTVVHSIIEQAWNGKFDGLDPVAQKSALEDNWELLISAQYDELMRTPRLADVPQPSSWPGYFEKKTLAVQSALAIARRSSTDSTITVERSVEIEFRPSEIPILGVIDRIDDRNGSVSIVDLKTSQPDHALGPRESYVEQLLFYAFAWWKETGTWPTDLRIEYQDGTQQDVALDKNRATDVVADAVAKLRVFNSTPKGEFENAATPSKQACRWCNFRGACDSFLSQDFDEETNLVDFKGHVISVGEDKAWFDLKLNDDYAAFDSVRIIGAPDEYVPELGEFISIGNAVRRRGRNLGVNWQSVLWRRQ